jgi:hypothetical protein
MTVPEENRPKSRKTDDVVTRRPEKVQEGQRERERREAERRGARQPDERSSEPSPDDADTDAG